jgi:flagellar biosynthetic protein FliR
MPLLDAYAQQFYLFVLVLTRVSGLLLTAPIFGPRSVPMRVRAFLAIGLSLIITPLQIGVEHVEPGNLVDLLVLMGREALLGLSLGLAVLILFTGLQVTGHVIGQISGMSLADVYDPTFESEVSVFAQLLDLVALAVFLVIGGQRQVLSALLDTFRARPVGTLDFPAHLVDTLVGLMSESFVVALRAAAPIMVALLMSVLILGLISRTLPQLNVMAVGFSLNGLIMLAVLAICIGAIVDVMIPRVDGWVTIVRDALVYSSS